MNLVDHILFFYLKCPQNEKTQEDQDLQIRRTRKLRLYIFLTSTRPHSESASKCRLRGWLKETLLFILSTFLFLFLLNNHKEHQWLESEGGANSFPPSFQRRKLLPPSYFCDNCLCRVLQSKKYTSMGGEQKAQSGSGPCRSPRFTLRKSDFTFVPPLGTWM